MANCWCGNSDLVAFTADYRRCTQCESLVVSKWPDPETFRVEDDERDFYGQQYHQKFVATAYGYPDLEERARADLPERCLHWLKALMKYLLPPATVLELGSGHGGFVALLSWAGFRAQGLELSPWLATFASETFNVSILKGSVESQPIRKGSLDAIVLMDVLEHLPDPVGTMRHCMSLLGPLGVLLIQTPRYPAGETFEKLVELDHKFVLQLKPNEHLFLFSEEAVRKLFLTLGGRYVYFEPAIFSHYDMFFVVSQRELAPNPQDAIAESLKASTASRLVLALLDQDALLKKTCRQMADLEQDRNRWREWFEGMKILADSLQKDKRGG